MLIGGGEFSKDETGEIDRAWLDLTPEARRVAFIPAASGSVEYGRLFSEYLSKLRPSIEVELVPIYRPRDARRGRNLEKIRSADAIYLGAGRIETLLAAIRGEPAETALAEALERGATIVAIGASACALGEVAVRLPSGDPIDGLGWLERTLISAPFLGDAARSFGPLVSSSRLETGIGIPPLTALVIESGGRSRVEGVGEIAVVRKPG